MSDLERVPESASIADPVSYFTKCCSKPSPTGSMVRSTNPLLLVVNPTLPIHPDKNYQHTMPLHPSRWRLLFPCEIWFGVQILPSSNIDFRASFKVWLKYYPKDEEVWKESKKDLPCLKIEENAFQIWTSNLIDFKNDWRKFWEVQFRFCVKLCL